LIGLEGGKIAIQIQMREPSHHLLLPPILNSLSHEGWGGGRRWGRMWVTFGGGER